MLNRVTQPDLPGHLIYISDQTLSDYGYLVDKSFVETQNVFYQSPSLHDIRQSTMENCYFLAPLMTLVSRNPEIIRQIIIENDDFFYVNLFLPNYNNDYKLITYQVDKTKCVNEQELLDGHRGDWVFLLEKAYSIHRILSNHPNSYKFGMENIISNGFEWDAYSVLLGMSVETLELEELLNDNSNDEDIILNTYEKINSLLNNGELICAASYGSKKLLKGLESDHTYAIHNVYNKDGCIFITLSNPYGYNKSLNSSMYNKYYTMFKNYIYKNQKNTENFENKNDILYSGTFDIKLKDFINSFSGIIFTDFQKIDNINICSYRQELLNKLIREKNSHIDQKKI